MSCIISDRGVIEDKLRGLLKEWLDQFPELSQAASLGLIQDDGFEGIVKRTWEALK